MNGTTYTLSGRTYPHRRYLSQRGAEWNAAARVWTITVGGNGAESFLRGLAHRGIRVTAAA